MKQYKTYGNYDKFPATPAECPACVGPEAIAGAIRARCAGEKCVVVFECYPGTDREEIDRITARLSPVLTIDADDCAFAPEKLTAAWQDNLTEDRVFGKMTTAHLEDYFEPERISTAREQLAAVQQGICVVAGTGASLITRGDVLVYCDLSRWEIQLRWRRGGSNWRCHNPNDPQLSKYKRGFFIEWRLADRLKQKLLPVLDFLVDTNKPGEPKLLPGDVFRAALTDIAHRPFSAVPYFDPGVWGGQWMKQVCGLPPEEKNYVWSFDGVPEENSLLLACPNAVVEIPAIFTVLWGTGAGRGRAGCQEFPTVFRPTPHRLPYAGGAGLPLSPVG